MSLIFILVQEFTIELFYYGRGGPSISLLADSGF